MTPICFRPKFGQTYLKYNLLSSFVIYIYIFIVAKQVYDFEFGVGHQKLGPTGTGRLGIAGNVAVLYERRSTPDTTGGQSF